MEENPTVTQDTEVKEVTPGSVEEITNPEGEQPKEEVKHTQPETVPLAVYLDLKKDVKELRDQLKEAPQKEKQTIAIEGLNDLASKYPDVNQEFIQDILDSATKVAEKKIDAKYSPILQKQEEEKKQEQFNKALEKLVDSAIEDNKDVAHLVDKDLIKTLAVTPKYKNTPITEIIQKVYGGSIAGKDSSENDQRSSADRVAEVVDFSKMSPEQKNSVMADANARQKYFDWLDKQPFR